VKEAVRNLMPWHGSETPGARGRRAGRRWEAPLPPFLRCGGSGGVTRWHDDRGYAREAEDGLRTRLGCRDARASLGGPRKARWIGGQLLIPLDGHNKRTVIGTWASRADWEAWHEDSTFAETRARMDGLQEGRSEMVWYEVVTEGRA
jgi:hypothetical protein